MTALALILSVPVLAQNKDLRVLDAVKRRDQKAFTSLIKSKADLNATQPDGATALAWAVHLGQRSMAEALLDAGANANTVDEYGETPLTLAAANGDGVLVQRLLDAGAKATATRWNGETALMIAAGAGSVEGVRQLVLHGADVNAADPRRGQTPLMWAAAEGHTDVVSALLEIGANAKAVSKAGFTALVFAVTKNDVESIDKLVAAGRRSELHATVGQQATAGGAGVPPHGSDACAAGTRAPISLHATAAATRRCIWPRRSAIVAVVKALLAKGADPNVRTPPSTQPAAGRGGGGGFRGGPSGEQTPLMMAARADHLETMRALVAGGADPSIRAQDGANVLMAAASGGRLPTVQYAYELDPHVDVVTTGTGNTDHASSRSACGTYAARSGRGDAVPCRPRREARRDECRQSNADLSGRWPAGGFGC